MLLLREDFIYSTSNHDLIEVNWMNLFYLVCVLCIDCCWNEPVPTRNNYSKYQHQSPLQQNKFCQDWANFSQEILIKKE